MAPSPKSGLRADTHPETALRHIAAGCHADLLKYRAAVLKSAQPNGIHQTRVALRRLRAAFGLFRDAIDGPAVRSLAAEARWLARECGPARDLQVFLTETVTDVPPVVRRVGRRLADIHLQHARAALSGARFAAFDRALQAFAAKSPAASPATPSADNRLDAFGRTVLDARLAKALRRGRKLEQFDADRLHRLRIAIKKLRYAASFLAPAFASTTFASMRVKPYIEATVRLQGALGALNDRAVAAQVLADLATAARPTEDVALPLKALAKQVASGEKRRRRRLERAWADFRKAERFWRA
ncbi:MAG: CHAD domain-containing protein [Reyranella sp.]|uniref:CHAD domain-containing protein n=1 Tax=Reyranella sp. TaxID=1929291 RepID=UPI0011F4DF25|nr:CHAD domain-containing protein [Reyranella sp.]TAJ42764.1 MAG: CHAD domain-containing protein [Reyranella sp.]